MKINSNLWPDICISKMKLSICIKCTHTRFNVNGIWLKYPYTKNTHTHMQFYFQENHK